MKFTAQVFTKKGFYGKPIEMRVHNVAEVAGKLITGLDKLPDQLEGENCVDWTRITIEIKREG